MSAETGTTNTEPDELRENGKGKDTSIVKVTVFAPRFRKGRKFTWPKDMTVAAAAQEAATEFEYGPGNYTLEKDGVALDRDLTIGAAGIEDKDELGLVDTGGGV